jgi:hypothetical protein
MLLMISLGTLLRRGVRLRGANERWSMIQMRDRNFGGHIYGDYYWPSRSPHSVN